MAAADTQTGRKQLQPTTGEPRHSQQSVSGHEPAPISHPAFPFCSNHEPAASCCSYRLRASSPLGCRRTASLSQNAREGCSKNRQAKKQPENQAQFAWKDAAHILAACGRKPPINPDPASKGVVPKRRLLSLLLFQSGRVAPLNTGTHFLSNLSPTPHLL